MEAGNIIQDVFVSLWKRRETDRKSDFEPQIIPKGQRMSDKLEEVIIGMYTCGMITSDISEQVKQVYGVDVSAELFPMSPTRLLNM